MSAKGRLDAVQSALQQRGVQDVKFCLAPGVSENGGVDVMAKVADFLEAYQRGDCVRVSQIGRSQLHVI